MLSNFIKGRAEAHSNQLQPVGIGGFELFARVTDNVSLEANAPTQMLEDGSFANDHIILEPLRIVVTGVVANTYAKVTQYPQEYQAIKNIAGRVSSMLPAKHASTINRMMAVEQQVKDAAAMVDNYIDLGRQAFNLSGSKDKGLTEQFQDFMEGVYYAKQLIDIEVGGRTYDDMAVTSIRFATDNEREQINFEIEAQQVKFVQTVQVEISKYFKKPSPAVKDSVSSEQDKGAQSTTSLLGSIMGR